MMNLPVEQKLCVERIEMKQIYIPDDEFHGFFTLQHFLGVADLLT